MTDKECKYRVISTRDGLTWQTVWNANLYGYYFKSVAYNKFLNLFCATGVYYSNRNPISNVFVSSDGINWTAVFAVPFICNNFFVTSLGSLKKFIIEGNCPLWSDDGYHWNFLNINLGMPKIDDSFTQKMLSYNDYTKDILVQSADNHLKILRSIDGINFNTIYENPSMQRVYSQFAYNKMDKSWLVLVDDGYYANPQCHIFYALKSTDGIKWNANQIIENRDFRIYSRLRCAPTGDCRYCNFTGSDYSSYVSSVSGDVWKIVNDVSPFVIASTEDV